MEIFLMGDGVHAARAGQEPREAHVAGAHAARSPRARRGDRLLRHLLPERGLGEGDLVAGVHVRTIHDLAASLAACDRTLAF